MRAWLVLLAAGSVALMSVKGSPQPAAGMKEPPLPEARTAKACVRAQPHWNHTRIWLEHDGRYKITAEGTWWDAGYRHGPGGGDSPTPTLKRFERFRRRKDARWFELICAVDSHKDRTYRIGCNREIQVPADTDGELICFANDVWLFYSNNTGEITLTVTRERRAGAVTGPEARR
jgi:hypothetical protein